MTGRRRHFLVLQFRPSEIGDVPAVDPHTSSCRQVPVGVLVICWKIFKNSGKNAELTLDLRHEGFLQTDHFKDDEVAFTLDCNGDYSAAVFR